MGRRFVLVAAGSALAWWAAVMLFGRVPSDALAIVLAGLLALAILRFARKAVTYHRGPMPVPPDGPEADFYDPPAGV